MAVEQLIDRIFNLCSFQIFWYVFKTTSILKKLPSSLFLLNIVTYDKAAILYSKATPCFFIHSSP